MVFAIAMSLLMVDKWLHTRTCTRCHTSHLSDSNRECMGGLKLQKAKTQVWSPTRKSIDNEPLLRTLQGRMGDKRSILLLGETVSEGPEDVIPIRNETFVIDHIRSIKHDLCKLEHFPHMLVKREAGLQIAWGLCAVPCPICFCMF